MKKIFLLLLLAFGGSGLNAQNMGKVGNGLGKSSKPIIPKHLKKGKPTIFRWEMMYGYILNDSILIPFEYEQLDEKFSDFMLAKRNGYWGAINKKGEVICLLITKSSVNTKIAHCWLKKEQILASLIVPTKH